MTFAEWVRKWFTPSSEPDNGAADEQSDETIEFDVTIEELTITDESE